MSSKSELIKRWDDFLYKMQTRFTEALNQGEEATLASLDENDYDYYSSFRTLTAIRLQISDSIINKINDTWNTIVEPAMRTDGGSYWADEARKGYDQTETLQDDLTNWLRNVEGALSKKYYNHAIQLINKDFYCSQCHSVLKIKPNFFQSQYVTCSYCGTVNTFVPETKYAQIGWNIVNNIAAANSADLYKVMESARKNNRDYAAAARNYYEKYYDERIKLIPGTASTREHDIMQKLKKLTLYGKN